ncbi:hypothetical protein CU097_006837 [Rhizopus azygosporus]|uniref:Uncharacterized protein n=1 Tax=Rhizopus azygosporus TaxID=86630 RepID=A0A367J2U6_RHIAZ|nr:hypothetical protein CU097_006837 [Rhizopus azygosporus]
MKVNIAIKLWNKTINMNSKLNMNTIVIFQCAQKDDLVINQEDSCVLQQVLDQFSAPDDRNHMKYYPAKICVVLKSCSVSQMAIETSKLVFTHVYVFS